MGQLKGHTMKTGLAVAGLLAAVAMGIGGCASSECTKCACDTAKEGSKLTGAACAVVAHGDPAKGAAALERLKPLAGEWDIIGDDGKRGPGLVISVSSGGSSVREIMFPGSGHEMTNMYHADGDTIVMTHYCAVGNQPRMRAKATNDGPLAFEFDSVTNLKGDEDTYMGSMVLTMVDANTLRQDWNHYTLKGGKAAPTNITFKRKGT
jgi:hypothetical protein